VNAARGPTVAIVAPSGYPQDGDMLARAKQQLEGSGCHVISHYDAAAVSQRFGADDCGRLAQLHAAAADPEVDVVLALRGGYGLSRLLPAIDFAALAASGKLFVGHSDFTALHMGLLTQGGAPSFAGPMICADFGCEAPSAFTLDDFWRCLRGPDHTVRFQSPDHAGLDVSGTVWGGNLSMLTHLIGTPFVPRIQHGILFIEDVNEHPYRIERMLLQMAYAGLLNQKAILFGDFSGYRLSDYDNGYDFAAMMNYLRERLGVPMVRGLPFGHMVDKVTLPVGSQGRLQADGESCVLTMSGYPTLA
jgi:muramoyltetrapeptide carboxypeptidase